VLETLNDSFSFCNIILQTILCLLQDGPDTGDKIPFLEQDTSSANVGLTVATQYSSKQAQVRIFVWFSLVWVGFGWLG
jgi:hypothetical protein